MGWAVGGGLTTGGAFPGLESRQPGILQALLQTSIPPYCPWAGGLQADEVCVAWALVSLCGLPTLHAERKLSVPLRGGPLARRLTLQQCAAAAVAAAAAGGLSGASGNYPTAKVAGADIRDASLAVRLAPLSAADAAGAGLLPAAAVLSHHAAKALGWYRQLLAEALATAEVHGWYREV